jgi:hypothetical protein
MENQNNKTTKSTDQSESLSELKQKSSGKSRLELTIELLVIDLEILTVKKDLELCKIEDMPEQRKILLDSYTLLLNKRNEIIKEL